LFEKNGIILHHCDARDLNDVKADMALTDAPYKLESGGNNPKDAGRRMRGKFEHTKYDNSGSIVEAEISWDEVWRVLRNAFPHRPDAHVYCMANNRHVSKCQNAAEANGFYFHNLLVWNKSTPTPNRWYMKNLEFILFMKIGNAFPINNCSQGQYFYFPFKPETEHPTEKPVELMANFIRQSSNQGDLVFDPFAGSGATLIAAMREGRRAIGCEINKEYYEAACERLDRFTHTRSLF